jgi:microcompartment protein CcmL/EutN
MSRPSPSGPALAVVSFATIPSGVLALDRLLKEAPVELLGSGTVHCGSYLVAFAGEVEAIERSFRKALESAGSDAFDQLFLPAADERIVPAFRDRLYRWPAPGDTALVVEAPNPPRLIAAIDRALKGASVELVEMRLADGLGGKAVATLWGETSDVEAALVLAQQGAGVPLETSIIRAAEDGVVSRLGSPSTFFREWRG